MSEMTLHAVPITPERFAPFGDVIHAAPDSRSAMNDARFKRFGELAQVHTEGRNAAISIVRCRVATSLPYRFDMVERHPYGTQAFIPLSRFRFFVVVAAARESVEPGDLHAFVTNGRQGINYRKGVWHMPMIAQEAGQEFVIVDRGGNSENCEEHYFSEPVTLVEE